MVKTALVAGVVVKAGAQGVGDALLLAIRERNSALGRHTSRIGAGGAAVSVPMLHEAQAIVRGIDEGPKGWDCCAQNQEKAGSAVEFSHLMGARKPNKRAKR